ncbi:MAG: hypothetical protein SGPRY_013567, partial [Prymnesium sp.]
KTRPPAARAAGAVAMCVLICAGFYLALHHLAHAIPDQPKLSDPSSRAKLLLLPFALPLGTAAAIGMLIPLGVYLSDYAAFQRLNVVRPDHFVRLLIQVYSVWITSPNGKLSSKDL